MLPGPRTLACLLLRRSSGLDEKEQMLLKQLYERSPELVYARRSRSNSSVSFVNVAVASWMTGLRVCARRVHRNCPASAATCSAIGPPSMPD